MTALQPPDYGTTVPLLYHFERMAEEHQRQHDLMDRASSLALETLNERMRNTNEWRAQSSDREATWVSRDMHAALESRVTRIDNKQSRSDGQWALIVGAASLLAAFASAGAIRLLFG